MNAEKLDAAFWRWLQAQPDQRNSSYHVQVKLWASEVKMAQLTALGLPGWIILDWRKRGLGISTKRAIETSQPPTIVSLLDALKAPMLHAQVQVVLAPTLEWSTAYSATSLTPDLIKVLDAGHASVLNVVAERTEGDWKVILAHLPPSDEPIPDFA